MKNKGVAIIEMVIVTAIVIILTATLFANYNGGEDEMALKRSIHQVALDIRRAQGMASASRDFKGAFQGGYGVYFSDEQENYTLFVDCDSNGYFSGAALSCSDCTSGSCISGQYSESVEVIPLEAGIYFTAVTPSTNDNLSIVFNPPDPTVTFYPDAALASLTLSIENYPSSQKIVEVNKAGLIEVK
jgi:Tfp pilus assembly protein FimT